MTNLCIVDAVEAILQAPAPVLLIDTSSVLDILRAPIRENYKHKLPEYADKLIQKAKAPQRDIWLIITSVVEREFNENHEPVAGDVAKIVNDVEARANGINQTMASLGLQTSNIRFQDKTQLQAKLLKQARDFMKECIILDRDQTVAMRAIDREAEKKAPSGDGKGQSRDCQILEHFLELTMQLRNNAFRHCIGFVTNNSKDYGPVGSPKEPIDQEFDTWDISYGNNFAWAYLNVK
ncbi:PIN domain-containing protein [Burkholderia ubonensis]|uniref:PIN domain-containing protein n=1 Tax=Burkholderia ubonensis TaxID=101571 RepID=UPI000AC9122F|nr:PIN domain-containing protein [Burkholderia ubonensis]